MFVDTVKLSKSQSSDKNKAEILTHSLNHCKPIFDRHSTWLESAVSNSVRCRGSIAGQSNVVTQRSRDQRPASDEANEEGIDSSKRSRHIDSGSSFGGELL